MSTSAPDRPADQSFDQSSDPRSGPAAARGQQPDPLAPYDAVLLLSFGGPESVPEVMPFLERVTGGRVPRERLDEVAQHYYARDGVSPINDENRRLIAALEAELATRGSSVPVLWANRNTPPELPDTLRQAGESGLGDVLTIVTSAYPSYSSCRVYREALAEAVEQVGAAGPDAGVPALDVLRPYGLTPGFLAPMARLTAEGVEGLARETGIPQDEIAERIHVMFVTHSIPDWMNETSGPPGTPGGYVEAHERVRAHIVDDLTQRFGAEPGHSLTYCSRSGSPRDPWLEPDVNDALAQVAQQGVRAVVVVPIGFVSDHMEVVYDLDEQAAQTAAELGLAMRRVPTVRDDVEFVAGLVDLAAQRAASRRAGDRPRHCPAGCCANPRAQRPAVAEEAAVADGVDDRLSADGADDRPAAGSAR